MRARKGLFSPDSPPKIACKLPHRKVSRETACSIGVLVELVSSRLCHVDDA